jgi:hypothetical protein
MSLIGWLRGLFRSDAETRAAAESSHEERRRLTEGDIGRVFVRVDPNGHRGTYLYSQSLGGGSSPTASFVTFEVADGAAAHVSEAGYSNGCWYREVKGLSGSLVADVLERHDAIVEERLRDINQATAAEQQRNARLRARFGKPEAWISLGDGPTDGRRSSEFVVWYEPATVTYSIEVYGSGDRPLATRGLRCSHEPRFGIDNSDYNRIFGRDGELPRLVEQVESE